MGGATPHRRILLFCKYVYIYTILQNKNRRWLGAAPPPIIFEPYILPQQTIHRWKENLTANRIHFKYLKNILILRLYDQFSRNGSAMAPKRMFEKISNFKIMNILYIILKHVVWRFRIYNYFREIFNFRENMSKNRFR